MMHLPCNGTFESGYISDFIESSKGKNDLRYAEQLKNAIECMGDLPNGIRGQLADDEIDMIYKNVTDYYEAARELAKNKIQKQKLPLMLNVRKAKRDAVRAVAPMEDQLVVSNQTKLISYLVP